MKFEVVNVNKLLLNTEDTVSVQTVHERGPTNTFKEIWQSAERRIFLSPAVKKLLLLVVRLIFIYLT